MISYPQCVQNIIDLLETNGFKAYIVGGCVRDALMGLEPHDFDITTSARPNELQEVFKDYTLIPTGLKHGTVTVLADGMPIEVTTFRTDGKYTDNRRPESVIFAASFENDAMRRDFTVNAMAYNKSEGLLDYFGGKNDIDKRLIRCVGVPSERFNEDALRILRALRFSSALGFDIEQETSRAVYAQAELVKNISAERVREEFVKLICGKNAVSVLSEYKSVISVFIPELLVCTDVCKSSCGVKSEHWEHTVAALGKVPPVPYLRLAAFFNGFCVPDALEAGDTAAKCADIARTVMKRLKFDTYTTERVQSIIRCRDIEVRVSETDVKKCLSRLSADIFFDALTLLRAYNAVCGAEAVARMRYFDELESLARNIISQKQCFSLSELAVDGKDLISIGIHEGKQIGLMLKRLLELVIEGKLENDKTALIKYARDNFGRPSDL